MLASSSPTSKLGSIGDAAQRKGASTVAMPSGVSGAPFWDRPPSPAGGRNPPSPGTRRGASIYPTPLPGRFPQAGWAGAPHTRWATCEATAVPRGTSSTRNDFTGSPGRQRGVRLDRPKPSEGRSRERSRTPAPILLRAAEEGGCSPAALGLLSQTSAPASGLCRAQVAARKPEPSQPERSGCQLQSWGGAAGSPQSCWRGPQLPAAPSAPMALDMCADA